MQRYTYNLNSLECGAFDDWELFEKIIAARLGDKFNVEVCYVKFCYDHSGRFELRVSPKEEMSKKKWYRLQEYLTFFINDFFPWEKLIPKPKIRVVEYSGPNYVMLSYGPKNFDDIEF